MKNFVQAGETLTLTAPYAVASGEGLLVGSIFGVATSAAANGAVVEAATCGVFTLKKTSAQAWAVGDLIFWNNTTKECTTVADGNTLIGAAVAAASNPSSTGRVKLNGDAANKRPIFGTATLDFPSIAAVGTQSLTISVPGAVVGDPVALALPAVPNAGVVFNAYVSAADTVTVRASNITAGAIDPASASYTVAVLKA